jgi:hypothetical protein
MSVSRLYLLQGEAEDAFGTENAVPALTDIRALDPVLTLEQQVHQNAERQARITQFAGHTLGRKSGRVGFSVYMRGDGVALTAAATPAKDSLQSLIELALGGGQMGDGGTCITGCSSTSIIMVNTAMATSFTAGQAVMVAGTGTDGGNEISVLKSRSQKTWTLEYALSAAPASTAKVYNSYTAYVDPAATTTWQFKGVGADADDVFYMYGCVGGFTFADLLGLEDVPKISFDFFASKWVKTTDTLAAGTFDGGALLGTSNDLEVHYQTDDTSTRNLIAVSSLEVNPGVTWTPLYARGSGDVEHVERIRLTRCEPTVTFTADAGSAFWSVFSAQTAKRITLMFGKTAGQSWCIDIPRAVMSTVPARAEHAEQTAITVTLRGLEDDTAATAIGRSPIRIHRL